MKKDEDLAAYFMQLGKEVFHLLRRKGAKKEDAEDILQNTFYKMYTLLDELTENNLRPLFFRIALNEWIDLKRKKETKNISLTEELYAKLQQKNDDFATLLAQDEILFLMKDVKEEYREIFYLKYYYDFSYREIAEILNIKENSVKQKLYRARKSIQEKIGGERHGEIDK